MRKYSILIVDDEENVCRLLEKIFKNEGFITHKAFSGEGALKLIDSTQVDIVISDIKMPGMNGIDLLKKIKNIDPSIKVVMITAFATVETAVEALRIGASDYITKPFDIHEVISCVKNIIDNSNETDGIDNAHEKSTDKIENYFTSKSSSMNKIMRLIEQVADVRSTVMLYGETGTGKEIAARALHNLSSRREKPFIKVNCAAIPEQLLESELFGYEKGAFTGAVIRKPGKFELANEGTIFLDEIGDISPAMQVKLLRVLQEREIEHLGGIRTVKVDVRVISATNKNLEELVQKGLFRNDLYYRLNVVPIYLPPLRDRKEDIDLLIDRFLKQSAEISGKPEKKISKEAYEKLNNYYWPGNVRELENIIERCVVVTTGNLIDIKDLPSDIIDCSENLPSTNGAIPKLDDAVDNVEREIIIKTLEECDGNRTRASEVLGISRRSLHRKIIKYNIED